MTARSPCEAPPRSAGAVPPSTDKRTPWPCSVQLRKSSPEHSRLRASTQAFSFVPKSLASAVTCSGVTTQRKRLPDGIASSTVAVGASACQRGVLICCGLC
jgi:hypothetical protein